MTRLPWRHIAIGGVVLILLGVGAVAVGTHLGRDFAETSHVRLSVLWPDVMTLPDEDRALLAWLSLECRLPEQAEGRTATITCLRDAARVAPETPQFGDAAAKLEKLLRSARPASTGSERI